MDKTNAVTPHCVYVDIKRSLEGGLTNIYGTYYLENKFEFPHFLRCSCFGFYKFPIVHSYKLFI